MSASRAFIKDRDAAFRALDFELFDKFCRKWKLPRPKQWVGDAWLGAIHKARLHINSFTEAEKDVSRTWLSQHNYTEEIGAQTPCPACGSPGPSRTDCPVCGLSEYSA